MTQEIEIPFGRSVEYSNKRAVRNVIVNETGREAHIRMKKRKIVIEPESPVHADNIIHVLEDMDLKFYHE